VSVREPGGARPLCRYVRVRLARVASPAWQSALLGDPPGMVAPMVFCERPNGAVLGVCEGRHHGFRRPVITAIAGRERQRRSRSSAPPFPRMQKRRNCSRPGPVADLEEARLGAAHHLPPPTTGEPRRRRSRDVVDDREDPGAHLRGARVQEEIGRNEAIGCAVVDDVPGLGRRGSPSHLHGRGRRAWRRSGAATRRATSSPGHHADLGAEDRGERHDGPQLRVRLCREQATDRRVVPVCVSRELRLRQPGLDPATQRTPPDI